MNSPLMSQHEFIFPQLDPERPYNFEEMLPTINLVLAEVSYPSIGVGVELGLAKSAIVPIICIHRNSIIPSYALNNVSHHIYGYPPEEGILTTLNNIFEIMGYK